MMIDHPLLGLRDSDEFVYLGDACLIERPETDHADALSAFCDYVYLRDNPAGVLRELWYHEHGDRSWLVISRDTRTHQIIKVELARDVACHLAAKKARA